MPNSEITRRIVPLMLSRVPLHTILKTLSDIPEHTVTKPTDALTLEAYDIDIAYSAAA